MRTAGAGEWLTRYPSMLDALQNRKVHLSAWLQRYAWWLLGGAVVVSGLLAWRFGPGLWTLVRDEQALEAFIANLGWLGPVALVLINVAQIVVAPIPGYVVQAAAGYLYGPFWGGVWGSVGLLLGSMLAMALARIFGRPLVLRLVSAERLARWERLTHSTSTLIWFLILLAPTGDLPYFMAGLAQVSFVKILVLTLVIRVPTVFVVAAAGAGVWILSGWQLGLIFVGLGALLFLFLRYQERILHAVDRRVQQRLSEQEII